MVDFDINTCTHMSPAQLEPILGDSGVCAVARDLDLRLLWCNEQFATNMDSTPEALIGTMLSDCMTEEQAYEREKVFKKVKEDGCMHAHQQVWVGARWLTRCWPLDPEAFGQEGYFVLITRLCDDLPTNLDEVTLVRSADLGHFESLTPRELEVLYYLGMGLSVADVAKTLFRADKTIGRHAESIYKKMGYSNRAALVKDVVENGLVSFSGEEWKKLTDPRAD